jgi:hypothetical protein
MDEDNVNENLVQQLALAFDDFYDEGNYEKCKQIIEQIREYDVLAAKLLEAELLNTPINSFRYGNI